MAELIDREATYEVLTAYYHHKTDIQHNALREALNKVPSVQPNLQPTCNQLATDYIGRQAAINAIENTDCELPPCAWDELTDAIMRVPSADIDLSGFSDKLWKTAYERGKVEQVRHGHWMLCEYQNQDDVNNGNYLYICSNCKHSDIHARTVDVPYCWYCGARMDGET